jgi:peptide/nickel transport system permease protein
MLDVMQEDYIRTARAKGLPQSRILFSHELRNALVPTITVLGLQLGGLLSGALILESIFGIPGIGRGIVQAALVRDYTVIQTFATLLVFIMLSVNLVIDIIYRLIDPRISYFEKSTLRQRQDLKISDDTQMMGERS